MAIARKKTATKTPKPKAAAAKTAKKPAAKKAKVAKKAAAPKVKKAKSTRKVAAKTTAPKAKKIVKAASKPKKTITKKAKPSASATKKARGRPRLSGLYRAVWSTALLRNFPSYPILFGGAKGLNNAMGNQNNESITKDLVAKTGAALLASAAFQPGEVLRVNMQVNQCTLWETLRQIPLKKVLTNGLIIRLTGAGRLGAGYFIVDQAMTQTAKYFGEEVVEEPANPTTQKNVKP